MKKEAWFWLVVGLVIGWLVHKWWTSIENFQLATNTKLASVDTRLDSIESRMSPIERDYQQRTKIRDCAKKVIGWGLRRLKF